MTTIRHARSDMGVVSWIPKRPNKGLRIKRLGIRKSPCLEKADKLASRALPMVWVIILHITTIAITGKVMH